MAEYDAYGIESGDFDFNYSDGLIEYDRVSSYPAEITRPKRGRGRPKIKPDRVLTSGDLSLMELLGVKEGEALVLTPVLRHYVQCTVCLKLMDPRSDGSKTCSPECFQADLKAERERVDAERFEASDAVYRKSRHLDGCSEDAPESRLDAAIRVARAPTVQEKPRNPRTTPEPLNPAAMTGRWKL
jgi:hypothetical protein